MLTVVADGCPGHEGGKDASPSLIDEIKTANVLAALPRSARPGAKKALAEIWGAEDATHARAAVKAFEAAYGTKFPKAVAKITGDADELLAFYDYPCEHWVHLRTTNPIESTFATVRHRTKVTQGPGSRVAGLAMAFKLIESAQDRWRAVNAPTWSPWSALEQPSPAASSPNDLTISPSARRPEIHRTRRKAPTKGGHSADRGR